MGEPDKTKKYWDLLQTISSQYGEKYYVKGPDDTWITKEHDITQDLKECCDTIAKLEKTELNTVFCDTITYWAGFGKYWKKLSSGPFMQILEHLVRHGADPNSLNDGIFKVVESEDIEYIDAVVKLGVDVCLRYPVDVSYRDKSNLSLLEYYVYYCVENKQKPRKKMIYHLLDLGVSDDLTELSSNFYYDTPVRKPYLIYKTAQQLVKIYKLEKAMEQKIAELEQDLKEAKDYIFELECRPPELGGPEYEAGRKRWEARQN